MMDVKPVFYLCSHYDNAADHDGDEGQGLHAPHEPPAQDFGGIEHI